MSHSMAGAMIFCCIMATVVSLPGISCQNYFSTPERLAASPDQSTVLYEQIISISPGGVEQSEYDVFSPPEDEENVDCLAPGPTDGLEVSDTVIAPGPTDALEVSDTVIFAPGPSDGLDVSDTVIYAPNPAVLLLDLKTSRKLLASSKN